MGVFAMPLFGFRQPWRRRYLRVFSVVFIVVIALMTGVYGWFTWNQAVNGVEADGVVVDRVEDEDGPTVYIRFTAEDGQSVRAMLTGVVATGRPRYDEGLSTGDVVRIRYVASDPGLVRLASEPAVEPTPFYYFGFFLLMGIGLTAYAWWPTARPPAGDRRP
ncbi:MAG: hypothetical protein ACRDSK_09900 [Actinophytocola sp.]|uniref:hypothetical protein n=1 Tax=Actinophytocola sp. TaxID=1872138 RepID=UPI003D6A437B